ncbi:hypothetical protein [uncultured Slackia sp.]|uniref:hypothetical protein n=1 Tax=uncultured Slackia sp. TaxID=665903 RepID=UPI0026DFF253|nr:hypothetical protein [uncultured Slackia sp.]
MGFKIKYTYPNGEEEIEDDVYETEQEAEQVAEDGVTDFATGAEILEDMGRDFIEGSLEYEIIEE